MKSLFALIFSICFIVSQAQTNYPDHFKTKYFEGVLYGKSSYILFTKGKRTYPKRAEVIEAENVLNQKIDSLQSAFNKDSLDLIHIVQKFKKYKRQYFSYFNEKNEKILIIQFLYFDGPDKNYHWLKEPMFINDGGDNFWSISYNLKTKTLFDLDISNGGA